MKKSFTAIVLSSAIVLLAAGCKKSSDPQDTAPDYTVPTTYNFSNASFDDASARLGMVTEMGNEMKLALTGVLDGQKLKDMFVNANARFTTAGYNTSGIQIKDQSAQLLQTDVPNFIDSLVAVSKSTVPASRGVAGIGASSANAASKYALTATGRNYTQIFNKSVMGGLISYQIVNTMGAASSITEHSWDLAFGYWGVPIDFPANKTGAKLWGSYSTQVDSGYKANNILMDAFLKGRAAISNNDTKTRDEQAAIILETFERLTGAAALQEVKEAKASLNDGVLLCSRLSECYGFVNSLRYIPKRKITDAQIDALLALFPANFYDLTLTQLNNIRDAVAAQYDFEAVKDIL